MRRLGAIALGALLLGGCDVQTEGPASSGKTVIEFWHSQKRQNKDALEAMVARFSAQFTGRRLTLAKDQVGVWLGGRDLRGMQAAYAPGEIILLEDERGRFLGLGKGLSKRIRNLLPRRLVY